MSLLMGVSIVFYYGQSLCGCPLVLSMLALWLLYIKSMFGMKVFYQNHSYL